MQAVVQVCPSEDLSAMQVPQPLALAHGAGYTTLWCVRSLLITAGVHQYQRQRVGIVVCLFRCQAVVAHFPRSSCYDSHG